MITLESEKCLEDSMTLQNKSYLQVHELQQVEQSKTKQNKIKEAKVEGRKSTEHDSIAGSYCSPLQRRATVDHGLELELPLCIGFLRYLRW